jgi:hypothetical protein
MSLLLTELLPASDDVGRGNRLRRRSTLDIGMMAANQNEEITYLLPA